MTVKIKLIMCFTISQTFANEIYDYDIIDMGKISSLMSTEINVNS